MKGIYKKISVGVLAAALLVGGSGVLKGGQAFADSSWYRKSRSEVESYARGWIGFKAWSGKSIEEIRKEERDDILKSFESWKKRLDIKFEVSEAKENDKVKYYYRDFMNVIYDLDENGKDFKSMGEVRVQIGLEVFDIKIVG